MAATMQHRMQSTGVQSSTRQQLTPISNRFPKTPPAAPAVRQQQQQHNALLQPLQALSTSLRQPLTTPVQQQQQQRLWQQQSQQQRRQQQRVLLVFAVPAEAAADADGEDVFDPNISAVDQDFDLLGAEVGVGYEKNMQNLESCHPKRDLAGGPQSSKQL